MTDTNEKFAKDTFKFHKDKFHQHLKSIHEIEDYTIVHSNFLPEFYPYYSEMNQIVKATVYKKGPKDLKGKFENRFKNEIVFFSNQLEENWLNACFYQIKDENKNNIVLQYNGSIKKPVLNQIYISIYDNDSISQLLFYHSDKNYLEDYYTYDSKGRITQIIRNGYWGNAKNMLPTRTFKFDYDENDALTLFSKQLKANGQNEFEQVFPKIKR